jgi:GrpB-like predicted nucleotidyltransferase (UPF0157 family)
MRRGRIPPVTEDIERQIIGGREKRTIRVVDHDPAWSEIFGEVRRRVVDALGDRALRVEHIGSTSVPGLAAKPIVDVLVVVADVSDEEAYVPDLVDAGFELRIRESGHRMMRTPARDVHLHFYPPGVPEIGAYLDLRDRLRRDAGDRELYATTKRELALRDWDSMNHYAEAKSDVIAQILGRARGTST